MRGSFRRIFALVAAELLAIRRDVGTGLSLAVFTVIVGVLGPAGVALQVELEERDRAADEDDDGPVTGLGDPTWPCQPGRIVPVAVAGDVPDWLDWPDPVVPVDDAAVLLRFGSAGLDDALVSIDIVELDEEARLSPVSDCVWSRVRDLRRSRLRALGITEEPRLVVATRHLDAAGAEAGDQEAPPARPAAMPIGSTLAAGLAVLLVSLFMEMGPRSRAGGWLETWLSLPGQRGDIVLAWWLVGVAAGAVGVPLVLLGDVIGTRLLGGASTAVPWALLPALLALMSALGVRAFLDVAEVRAALVRSVPVLLAISAAVGVALLVEGRWPGLGGLVPLGGLGLALADQTTGVALAVVGSLALTGVLLWDSVRVLERIAVTQGAMSATAARRARGDYFPEAVLLFFIAAGGASSWAPPELLLPDLVLRTALSLVLFLGLPALLVSVPLGLDRRRLLSWRAPPLRGWAVLPLVVAGTLSIGGLLWQLAVRWLPEHDLTDLYVDAMAEFQGPVGLFVVSVVPGVCEELLFRGAILGLLRQRLPAWAAIVLQALAFALLHGLAVRLPYTFVLGLALGVLVLRSGSLWPAIVAHTAHNLLSTVLPESSFEAWLNHPAAWAVGVLGLAATWWAGSGRSPPSATGSD